MPFKVIAHFCCRMSHVFGTKYACCFANGFQHSWRLSWSQLTTHSEVTVPSCHPHFQPICPHGFSKTHNHSDDQELYCIYSQSVLKSYPVHLTFTCFPSTSSLTRNILCFRGVIHTSRATLSSLRSWQEVLKQTSKSTIRTSVRWCKLVI